MKDKPRYKAIAGYENEFKRNFNSSIKIGVAAMVKKIEQINDTNISSDRRGSKNTR